MSIKQVIVFRKDLQCRKEKIASQVAHASLKVFLDRMERMFITPMDGDVQGFRTRFTPAMLAWLNWEEGQPGFTKIVVGCNDEAELYIIEAKAKAAGIIYALIKDNGVTEFHGVQTPTCICLGPDEVEKIDLITGNYKLL
jgi:PTH2 family peptidyl-tRNA hydrolase